MSQEIREATQETHSPFPATSSMRDSTFGVQSLEEAMSESLYSDSTTWSRGDSTEQSTTRSPHPTSPTSDRKRKIGYPPHPRITRPNQRNISSELPSAAGSSAASPVSLRSSRSPLRLHLRRASNSSANLSQPLTPLKLSPNPGMPTTPRSESVQSFRLSDEEASVGWETNSQAIQSSNGDEDDRVSDLDLSQEREPQLVMPSISMPARRPFTARGRNMGRLKVMVVGPSRVGKTSLIKSIIRNCEDIVHVDPVSTFTSTFTPSQSAETAKTTSYEPTKDFTEIQASTRPYPLWWSDMESSRGLWRRKSFGEGILERNISFIDTPGTGDDETNERIVNEIETLQLRNAHIESMGDNQLLNLFSGEGGTFVDAVLYLFEPGREPVPQSEHSFVKELASRTNLIPLIARADSIDAHELGVFREKIRSVLSGIDADWYSMVDISVGAAGLPVFEKTSDNTRLEPLAVSSALTNDSEIMDASLLMASDYLQPTVPSDLRYFLERFLSPSNISRMRHSSARKFLLWRRSHLGTRINLPKQSLLHSPAMVPSLSPVSSPYTGAGAEDSMLFDRSKVLVPYTTSSYYRSASPSATSDLSHQNISTSAHALAEHNSQQTTGAEPFRQIRLAKWAQDLQRSLANERKRYDALYAQQPAEWHLEHEGVASAGAGFHDEKALISRNASQQHLAAMESSPHHRPTRGKLGGEVAVIDPLGILSLGQVFRRQGWIALRVVGGCGFVGAVAWWVLRNWAEVQEWVSGGGSGGNDNGGMAGMLGSPIAVPAPERGWWEGWVG
jgi:septin family protein